MYLVQLKLTGVDPPQTLPANMVPPSMRGPGLVSSRLLMVDIPSLGVLFVLIHGALLGSVVIVQLVIK